MNIPSLPTDNLYKFIALSGIALAIFSQIYFRNKANQYYEKTMELMVELRVSQAKWTEFNKDYKELLSDLKKIETPVPEPAFLPKEELYEKGANIISDEKKRQAYKFYFDYEEKLNPYAKIFKKQKIMRQKEVELIILGAKNKQISKNINTRAGNVDDLLNTSNIWLISGFLLALIGFSLWKIKVQDPLDEKLQLEILILNKNAEQ